MLPPLSNNYVPHLVPLPVILEVVPTTADIQWRCQVTLGKQLLPAFHRFRQGESSPDEREWYS